VVLLLQLLCFDVSFLSVKLPNKANAAFFCITFFTIFIIFGRLPDNGILPALIMDKKTILKMLESIRQTNSVGPKLGDYELGARVTFALDHGLIERSEHGNFIITPKGTDLLNGKLPWEELR